MSVLDSKSMFICAVFMRAVKSTNVSHLNMMFFIIPADPWLQSITRHNQIIIHLVTLVRFFSFALWSSKLCKLHVISIVPIIFWKKDSALRLLLSNGGCKFMQFIRSVKSHITHDSSCCVNQSVKSRQRGRTGKDLACVQAISRRRYRESLHIG